MKKVFTIFLILFLSTLLILPVKSSAVTSLSNVTLDIQPKNAASLATWTISFTIPDETDLGHVLISLAGFRPDLSQAKLSVRGLPVGISQVGKTNPSCASNCDDIRYYFNEPIRVNAGKEVVFTLRDVANPDRSGQTGINFISLFSSPYPQMDLAFNFSDYFVQLEPADENLIPDFVTDENKGAIQEVLINELFYRESSRTTKLTEIKDTAKVEDFTLDLLGKIKVSFKEPIDLSNEEAIHFIANLSDYMTFEYLYFWVDYQMFSFFKVPLEITFYDLPFVWEPDISKDDDFILSDEELVGFYSAVLDDMSLISFVINEAGSYRVVPHLELYIADNQEITSEDNVTNFSGRISDPDAVLTFNLNGKKVKNLKPQINAKTGEFVFALELIDGANLIEVETQSNYGEINKITKIVHFQEPLAQVQEKNTMNPVYFIISLLILLGVLLVLAIRFLLKKKK